MKEEQDYIPWIWSGISLEKGIQMLGITQKEVEGWIGKKVCVIGVGSGRDFKQLVSLGVTDIIGLEPTIRYKGREAQELRDIHQSLEITEFIKPYTIEEASQEIDEEYDVCVAFGINFQNYARDQHEVCTRLLAALNILKPGGELLFSVLDKKEIEIRLIGGPMRFAERFHKLSNFAAILIKFTAHIVYGIINPQRFMIAKSFTEYQVPFKILRPRLQLEDLVGMQLINNETTRNSLGRLQKDLSRSMS